MSDPLRGSRPIFAVPRGAAKQSPWCVRRTAWNDTLIAETTWGTSSRRTNRNPSRRSLGTSQRQTKRLVFGPDLIDVGRAVVHENDASPSRLDRLKIGEAAVER